MMVNEDAIPDGKRAVAAMPAGSWPSTSGAFRAMYQPMTSPLQIPLAIVRTSSSPSRSSGTGRSSMRTSLTS
jgi:hypothetical protein